MPLTLTGIPIPSPADRISVRVWRWLPSNEAQWLYTYSGTVDLAVLSSLMQTVRQLTDSVPGEWRVDVIVIGGQHGLWRAVRDDLHALRPGVRPLLRRLPRLSARCAAPARQPTATLH